MRFRKLLAIPILASALAGCIKEDLRECYGKQNVTFLFQYNGAANSVFTDYIDQVDLFLFDAQGAFMLHRKAAMGELRGATPGMTFSLAPGTYYAVAWGNAGSNSLFSECTPGVTQLEDLHIGIDPRSVQTGDRWYYAPYKKHPQAKNTRAPAGTGMDLYEVVVPANKSVEKIMKFARAHRSIYVWVREAEDESRLPEVEATQLWCRYNSHLQTHAERRNFQRQAAASSMNSVVYSLAVFHHAYGVIDDALDVQIIRAAYGMENFTVNVPQFLADNPEADTDDIHIMVSFGSNLGVTVSLPEWVVQPVEPGID